MLGTRSARREPLPVPSQSWYDGGMPHFPKPAEGSWTEHYPELGTGPVSYDDSISAEFFELEREARVPDSGASTLDVVIEPAV